MVGGVGARGAGVNAVGGGCPTPDRPRIGAVHRLAPHRYPNPTRANAGECSYKGIASIRPFQRKKGKERERKGKKGKERERNGKKGKERKRKGKGGKGLVDLTQWAVSDARGSGPQPLNG